MCQMGRRYYQHNSGNDVTSWDENKDQAGSHRIDILPSSARIVQCEPMSDGSGFTVVAELADGSHRTYKIKAASLGISVDATETPATTPLIEIGVIGDDRTADCDNTPHHIILDHG